MKSLIYIVVCLISVPAFAVQLEQFTDPPTDLLPIDTNAPNIPCDQVLNELMKFKDMNRQHEDSVAAFLTQAVEKINGWYDLLSPLQGQQKNLEKGTFEPIKTGGEKMGMVVDYSYDNSALLASSLDRIIVSMRACPQPGAPEIKKVP